MTAAALPLFSHRPTASEADTMPTTHPRGRVAAVFAITDPDGSTRQSRLIGRLAWALGNLIDAGADGCTPIDHPGPRWSHYVFVLRRDYRLNIETITEAHGGAYHGTHARYVLHSQVRRADPVETREAA